MTEPWCTGPATEPRRYLVDVITQGSPVFRARSSDGSSGPFALKQHGPVDEAAEQRIRSCHAALTELSHPGVQRCVEVFRGPGLHHATTPPIDEWDVLYTVCEWVEGDTLWAWQHAHDRIEVSALRQVAEALAALHDRGFIHGDVHPGNVVVTARGDTVLIDLDSMTAIGSPRPAGTTGILGFVPPETQSSTSALAASDHWQFAMLVVHQLLGHPIGRERPQELDRSLRRLLGPRRGKAVAALLDEMLQPEPVRRPGDLSGWTDRLFDELDADRRSGSRRLRFIVAIVLIAVASIISLSVLRGANRKESTPEAGSSAATVTTSISSCDIGAVLSPSGNDLLERARPPLEAELEGTCPLAADEFVNAVVLTLDGNEILVVSPMQTVARLTDVQWASYREIAGRQRPENAADVGGYPTSVSRLGDGVSIELSAGGIMVGAKPDDPVYWIPAQLRTRWERAGASSGEFGLPASHPFFYEGRLVQDFEYLEVSTTPDAIYRATDDIDFILDVPDDPGSALDVARPLAGRILRQRSGVAWFIDDDETRHWIPDGDTYFCVGGDAALVETDLPASAIWTLPAGEHARCG